MVRYYIFAAVLAYVLGFVAWRYRARRLALRNDDPGHALRLCGLLLRLVACLQQHRGMSSAWLAGDATFAACMRGKQADIAALLPEVAAAAQLEKAYPSSCLDGNQLHLFVYRWRCLVDELAGLTPEQGIARHGQLVSRLLEWVALLGEGRIEGLLVDQRQLGLARNFSHRLPLLSECLGQARAIGVCVAARGACPPVARVRLMFLIARAESLLEQATVACADKERVRRNSLDVAEMIAFIRTRMLLSSGVAVSGGEYFALATRVIDGVFEWIDACGAALDSPAVADGAASFAACAAG